MLQFSGRPGVRYGSPHSQMRPVPVSSTGVVTSPSPRDSKDHSRDLNPGVFPAQT